MSNIESQRLVLKACQLSFREGLSNTQIAARMGMSRFQVARLIRRGLDEGYVVIKVLEPDRWHADLERELERRFGLELAIVVDDDGIEAAELRRRASDAAGRLLVEVVSDGTRLGISLGRAMQEMVDQLPDRMRRDVSVVQLIGGTPGIDSRHDASMLAADLAGRFGSRPALLYAPAFVEAGVRASLMTEQSIRSTFEQFKGLDVAFLGIGAFEGSESSRLVYAGLLDAATTGQLRERGAVGDVLCYVFDAEGRPIESGLEERILAIGLDDLLRVPRRVGVASGAEKAAAVAGALRGGFVNVLVTDRGVAARLCEQEEGRVVAG